MDDELQEVDIVVGISQKYPNVPGGQRYGSLRKITIEISMKHNEFYYANNHGTQIYDI